MGQASKKPSALLVVSDNQLAKQLAESLHIQGYKTVRAPLARDCYSAWSAPERFSLCLIDQHHLLRFNHGFVCRDDGVVALDIDTFYPAFLKYHGTRRHDHFSETQAIFERVKVPCAMINNTVVKADARRERFK